MYYYIMDVPTKAELRRLLTTINTMSVETITANKKYKLANKSEYLFNLVNGDISQAFNKKYKSLENEVQANLDKLHGEESILEQRHKANLDAIKISFPDSYNRLESEEQAKLRTAKLELLFKYSPLNPIYELLETYPYEPHVSTVHAPRSRRRSRSKSGSSGGRRHSRRNKTRRNL